jgi:hypothetical protein
MPSAGGNAINLNSCISTQTFCIFYNANPIHSYGTVDTKNIVNVFVFSTPIPINKDTQGLFLNNATVTSKSKPHIKFSVDAPTNYEVIAKHIGTIYDNQIYIDCNLTGESPEKLASYNVPINSSMFENVGESNYMKMTVNFFIFCLALFFTYATIPVLYKYTVIDRINRGFTGDEKTKRMVGTDILIGLVVIYITTAVFFYGAIYRNYKMQTAAMGLTVLYILSVCILEIKKTDVSFRTTHLPDGGDSANLTIPVSKHAIISISSLKTVISILGDWLSKILEYIIYIIAALMLFITTDIFLFIFSIIDIVTLIELLTFGSFMVCILTIIAVAIFTETKGLFKTQKIRTT